MITLMQKRRCLMIRGCVHEVFTYQGVCGFYTTLLLYIHIPIHTH